MIALLAACSDAPPSTDSGGTSSPGPYHPAGWEAPAVHGLATKLQTETDCRACHGADLLGGTAGVACVECHGAGWDTTCTFCHGGVETDGGAPPEDIDDGTDPAGLSFRAHTAHVTENVHVAWDCTTCHRKPTSALTPGHLFDDDTPGVAEVDFTGGLSSDGVYEGQGSCTNLYCHGTGLVPGSYDHALPPPTCGGCHPDAASTPADQATMSGHHAFHLAGPTTCNDCHAGSVDVDETITDPALHVDGTVENAFPSGMVYADGTCTGVCHQERHSARAW